ncbi:CerR family C-terminal domain-containing protein [Desulfomicrobium sp. ZS1]|uniref:CerR family C-terminal domain-containing protein n=1 Tax=Desulfomicrobium sp. ZS1 TaxID=2952228 RepID=UPI0020B2BDF9|nr:CerR family C-terminal domain-containing protein [Desulfomicrobium sp. ZS1]UTF50008.1 CerR family C-terminal domain-containing protein [Desulfomicrobium sp. ZS1]
MTKKKPPQEKLLAAACDIFMDKGFRGTTVAEICARAGTNIAAVNYYFGGKEALYQEAWRHCLTESMRRHPPDGGVSPDAAPEERLRGRMKALMRRIADPENKDFLISQMEMVNPTGLLEEVMRTELIPLRKETLAVVRELLGPDADEQRVVYCEACLVSMCVHPLLMQRVRQKTKKTEAPMFANDLEAFAEHVVRFALAGVRATSGEDEP